MKKAYFIAGGVLAVLCLICLVLLLVPRSSDEEEEEVSAAEEAVQQSVSETYEAEISEEVEEVEEPEEESEEEESEAEEEDPYVSPVDFASLQAVNSDIYAWLYIPGTDINYAVVQSAEDDEWYLTHNADGEYSKAGALFTQATYNSTDFSDPVTVIYGHRSSSGAMFGQLQTLYSADGGLETYSEIIVYLPDQELHYTVFAAVPYDNRHILYTYNFENEAMYRSFLKTINNVRDLSAQFSETVTADTDDNLLILSTCLYGNSQKRYLILAREDVDITEAAAETAAQ